MRNQTSDSTERPPGNVARGRDASTRSLPMLLAGYRDRGFDLELLLDGLPYSAAVLGEGKLWIPWDHFSEVMERLENVGGREVLREIVDSMAFDTRNHGVRRSLSLAVSPSQLFNLLVRWMGPSQYPIHTAEMERLDDGRLRVVLTLPPHVRASEAFFRSTRTVFESSPQLLGLAPATVSAEIGSHRSVYWITLPPSGTIASRLKRVLEVFSGANSAIDELAEQQRELRRNHDALADSVVTLRERERLLEAEIEERRRAEQALRDSEAQLLRSQRLEAMGRLAGGIAHDFNNLLTTVLGYTGVLEDAKLSRAELDDGLFEIRRAAERATRLTAQLLAFSRRQVMMPQHLDLNAIVNEMESMLGRVLGDDVELRAELEPDLPGLRADPSQLEQVLLNLAVNARDAMPRGGCLTLRTSSSGEGDSRRVWLRVEDTGQGIEEEVRRQIFEPFFTTKEVGQGTGLGLSTVYGIVHQTGGRIEVESVVGEGSTFVIDFPAAEETSAKVSEPLPGRVVSGGRETVMVVEDEDSVRKLMTRVLSAGGYRVFAASGAEEAWSGPMHNEHVDLVISDVMMRGTSGLELAARLREERPDLPVLLVSGVPGEPNAVGPEFAFLPKPFTRSQLLERVRELLD
ncbi:MAG: response regulator [bacterium]|nr:response regulator [bacterium]